MFPSLARHINSLFLSSTGPTDKVGCKKSHEGVLPILISNEKVASSKIPPEFHLFWSLYFSLGILDAMEVSVSPNHHLGESKRLVGFNDVIITRSPINFHTILIIMLIIIFSIILCEEIWERRLLPGNVGNNHPPIQFPLEIHFLCLPPVCIIMTHGSN